MGPQIPPASMVTKVWVLGVYNNVAEFSFAGVAQTWGKPGLGEKPYNAKKYGTTLAGYIWNSANAKDRHVAQFLARQANNKEGE